MLDDAINSLLVIKRREYSDIVVGVPHHAPAGTGTLPCAEHKDSDENAGFLGQYLAEKLNVCSIIACNYPVDVNKFFRSDYSMQIASWNPAVLIEIHGHSGKRAKNVIEISSGSTENNIYSSELASRLSDKIADIEELNFLTVCGIYEQLSLKASKTVTINDGRWVAYHIELPPVLRKSDSLGEPPEIGYQFCDVLAETLSETHRNKDA